MADQVDSPLDDDLLRELGLEPAPKKAEPSKAMPPPPPPPPGKMPPPPRGDKGVKPPSPMTRPQMNPEAKAVPAKAEAPAPQDSQNFNQGVKNIVSEMPVQVVAVLGKKSMSMKEVLNLKPGEMVELKKLPQEAIDLVANGKLVARGELVLIDGKVGIQIKQIL